MENETLKVLTLDSLATIKQLIGGGGGGSTNLLSNYTKTPQATDAYNATYINSRLDGQHVIMGLNPSNGSQSIVSGSQPSVALVGIAAGDIYGGCIAIGASNTAYAAGSNIAIGNNAAADSGHYNISIGMNAWCSTQNTDNSIALGSHSTITRSNELSIGGENLTGNTRYLANVKAGELDTDAVNLKQMEDYVTAHAGGSSGDTGTVLYTGTTNAPSAITLLSPLSQFKKVKFYGYVTAGSDIVESSVGGERMGFVEEWGSDALATDNNYLGICKSWISAPADLFMGSVTYKISTDFTTLTRVTVGYAHINSDGANISSVDNSIVITKIVGYNN